MEVGTALAAADTREGGNGIPVAVAVTAKKEPYVALRTYLPRLEFHCDGKRGVVKVK